MFQKVSRCSAGENIFLETAFFTRGKKHTHFLKCFLEQLVYFPLYTSPLPPPPLRKTTAIFFLLRYLKNSYMTHNWFKIMNVSD